MSYVDLAKMTTHRRAEMEARVNTFNEKCDHAMSNIKKLKKEAQRFVTELNCGPAELRECYLKNITKLESYMYFITDFILAFEPISEETNSPEFTPEKDKQDNKSMASLLANYSFNTNNLMDVLSEPIPSTSCACSNLCPPEKPQRVKVPKEDQVLIAFSSNSTSSESMPHKKSEMVTKEVQCSLTTEVANLQIEDKKITFSIETSPPLTQNGNLPPSAEDITLPAQSILELDRNYHGVITHTQGIYFWIIIDDTIEFAEFLTGMTEYYQKNKTVLTIEQARLLSYCAIYDEESNFFYRAMTLKEDLNDPNKICVFVVDTGEVRTVSAGSIQPLAKRFCNRAPYARCCHLAGIDLELYNDTQMMRKYDNFMEKYINTPCTFLVDENQSESIGVYAMLKSGETLNNLLVQRGLAELDIEPEEKERSASPQSPPAVGKYSPHTPANVVRSSPHSSVDVMKHSQHSAGDVARLYSPGVACGPPDEFDNEIDPADPEYDDPVEAVTGYHNRDEEDICKHYKGGPDKTCFKGSRCTKKHIVKHPDGWTLDKVEVVGKLKDSPLPAPGTWANLHITYVAHFDHVYANVVQDKQKEEPVPEFGVVLPPMTFNSLVQDMNTAAARASYKPLKFTPATGEIVAAIYPPDNRWYRAQVLTVTRADQCVEVKYVDYGTVLWVKENQICTLCPRYSVLPKQAICCVLAGVHVTSSDSQHWARTKRALAHMVQDATLRAHIIARDYDKVTIELLDNDGYSVAQQLAAQGLVELREYQVIDDSQVTQRGDVP